MHRVVQYVACQVGVQVTLLEEVDFGDHFCLPGGGGDETVWVVFVCRHNFLERRFVPKLEVSDLVAKGDKFWAFQVEGNFVDNVAGASSLIS